MDTEAALQFLRKLVDLIDEYEAYVDNFSNAGISYWNHLEYKGLQAAIRRTASGAERIAEAVDKAAAKDIRLNPPQSHMPEYQSMREGLDRVIGILETQSDIDVILGPTGPHLAASGLHEWIWAAAARLWDDGHRRAAVQAAATHLETQLRAKLARHDVASASALPGEAFSLEPPQPARPRLRLPGFERDGAQWRSAHEGAQALGRGCFLGIRNLTTHTTEELPEQLALEYLAVLSAFARWVDDASVEEAG